MKRVAYALDPAQPASTSSAPTKTKPPGAAAADAGSASTNVKLQFSLPSFRQPPTTEAPPSLDVVRRILITIAGLAFFIFGYHNLWRLLH